MPTQRKAVAKLADSRWREHGPADPIWRAVELAQRGRMILDVSAADLDASERAHGPFHATTWHFRNAWYDARQSWDRLRADLGGATVDAALAEPPVTVLALGPAATGYTADPSGRWPIPVPGDAQAAPILLIAIGGQTYRVARVAGTPIAPLLCRLTRLHPPLEDGPYYAGRLHDRTTHCDCAQWIYELADTSPHALCKHLAALSALGWI